MEKKFLTDMNTRERNRYRASLMQMSNEAAAAAQALADEDDDQLLVHAIILSLVGGGVMKELLDVLHTAAAMSSEEIPEDPSALFKEEGQ